MKKGILQRCSRNWEEVVMGEFSARYFRIEIISIGIKKLCHVYT